MRLTISLLALGRNTLADGAGLLQVNVPALGRTGPVLEREREDGSALLDGVLAVGLVGGQDVLDGVERGRGGESVWKVDMSARVAIEG